MLITYNRIQLIGLKKSAKQVNLSEFPFGTIRKIKELEIQKRI